MKAIWSADVAPSSESQPRAMTSPSMTGTGSVTNSPSSSTRTRRWAYRPDATMSSSIRQQPPRSPEIKGAAVDGSFPLLRRVGAGPPGVHARLAGQPGGDRSLLALVSRAQLRSLRAVPPCLPVSRLGSAAVLIPGAPAAEAVAVLRRKARMTGAQALAAVGIARIEQCRDDPSRCSLAQSGAGHEVACVTVGQPAPLRPAFRLAAGALLLAATEVDDVEVTHPGQGTHRALVNHPNIRPRITAPRDPWPSWVGNLAGCCGMFRR